MGDVAAKISIENILRGIGLTWIETVDPLDLDKAVDAVKRSAGEKGVRAIIFKSPCIAVSKPGTLYEVKQDACTKCKVCITQLGCPAIAVKDGAVVIEPSLCYGCGLCSQVCPSGAIGEVECNE